MSYALDKAMIEALEAVVGIDHTETGVMTTDNGALLRRKTTPSESESERRVREKAARIPDWIDCARRGNSEEGFDQ